MAQRLYRSTTNKVISGVCGGLGEYFDVDPVLVRVITVLLAFATGFALLAAYVITWIIVPKRPLGEEPVPGDHKYPSWNKYLPGLILVALGIILLVHEHWYWFDLGQFWPIILIVLGLVVIFRRSSSYHETSAANTVHPQSHPNNQGGVS
jgi:phage shock protein C